MINMQFLRAVDFLPEVGSSVLRQRDDVLTLVARAIEPRERAQLIEEHAAQAQRTLERRVRQPWTKKAWEAAQRRGRAES